MMTEQTYKSDLAIPPGEYLDEVLEEMDITQVELAQRMRQPTQTINDILTGEQAITPDTARQLEQVVGVPAYFWNNLESEYQIILAKNKAVTKAQDKTAMADYLSIKKIPLNIHFLENGSTNRYAAL